MNICRKLSLLPGLLIALALLSSCGGGTVERQALSSEQIESKYASGTVLIKNTFYYSLSFGGGREFYFTGLDADGSPENLTVDLSELTPATCFGSGFLISKEGHIATNSHVASPSIDVSSARSTLVAAFNNIAGELNKEINDINEKLGMLRLAIIASEDYSERMEMSNAYDELSKQRDDAQEVVNALHSLGSMDYSVSLHSSIGIAYNDTYVTNMGDFKDCVTVADDPQHDLAILQLKDKKTPEGKHIFRIPGMRKSADESSEKSEEGKSNKVKVGKKLYMIGYNLGPTLAITDQGIQAQVTSGEVTQDTDGSKIMYSIPSLQGSSGSPVLDKYGKLIAVTFAGLSSTQSFNYGIKISHLKKLYSEL